MRLKYFFIVLLIFVSSLFSCLPNPKPVDEERDSFDRSSIKEYILSQPPSIQVPSKAIFGDQIAFLGYTVDREVKPGTRFKIKYYFKCLKPIDEDWQIFVHMDSWGGFEQRIHGDHYPVFGKYRTSNWRVGEIIVDEREVKVPSSYSAQKIAVYIGFYMGDTRMPISNTSEVEHDGQNRLRAGLITVNK
ncbi:MAG: hypothetical protein N3B13_10900 [Deltaproteobacteria bacterium]|nr:hypothetical protein [Deltaproteobacteria bacterium]